MGGDYNFPPYEYLDENGIPTGFNTELTRAIADVMGMDVEIRLGPWADVRQSLEGGEIDALQGMFYSAARDAQVDFSTPHTIVYHAIFVHKEETTIHSLEDLKGKTILVQRGDIMHDYAVEQQLTENLVAVETPVDALRLLNSTHYDAALLAKVQGLYLASEYAFSNITTVGDTVLSHPISLPSGRGWRRRWSLLNEGLRIKKNRTLIRRSTSPGRSRRATRPRPQDAYKYALRCCSL
jgi:polar amino acid transport system substrate-binding protein